MWAGGLQAGKDAHPFDPRCAPRNRPMVVTDMGGYWILPVRLQVSSIRRHVHVR